MYFLLQQGIPYHLQLELGKHTPRKSTDMLSY